MSTDEDRPPLVVPTSGDIVITSPTFVSFRLLNIYGTVCVLCTRTYVFSHVNFYMFVYFWVLVQ